MVEKNKYNILIGQFFRKKRMEKNLTMQQLSESCGHTSKGWYSKTEYGTSNLNTMDCIKMS